MKAPLKNFVYKAYPQGCVTQFYGENPELYKTIGLASHNGEDYVAPHGTPVYCIETGTVAEVKDDPNGYGRHIRIITDGETCNEWTYGHLHRIDVKQGQRVTEGDQVGLMGNTGFVVSGATPYWEYNPFAGTHLHCTLRRLKRSPKGWSYAGSDIKIKVLNADNGNKGAVDQRVYMEKLSAEVEIERLLTLKSLLQKVVELLKLKKSL